MVNGLTRKETVDETGRVWDHWVNEDGTENEDPIPQFKEGEWCWYIVSDFAPLLVKVLIEEVERDFRQQDDIAYLFYVIDEPVGNSLPSDEVYFLEEAREVFAKNYRQLVSYHGKEKIGRSGTIEAYRTQVQEWIAGTWGGDHPGFSDMPDKKLGVDYFNADSLLDEDGFLKKNA